MMGPSVVSSIMPSSCDLMGTVNFADTKLSISPMNLDDIDPSRSRIS